MLRKASEAEEAVVDPQCLAAFQRYVDSEMRYRENSDRTVTPYILALLAHTAIRFHVRRKFG